MTSTQCGRTRSSTLPMKMMTSWSLASVSRSWTQGLGLTLSLGKRSCQSRLSQCWMEASKPSSRCLSGSSRRRAWARLWCPSVSCLSPASSGEPKQAGPTGASGDAPLCKVFSLEKHAKPWLPAGSNRPAVG
eukprot:UN2800